MKRIQLTFPQRSDYLNSLKVLNKPKSSKEYHQLIEASASAYFETNRLTRWLFIKRFKLALAYLENIGQVDSLLDAGTGIGFFLPTLTKVAKNVIAIDNTEYSLKYAKSMCNNLRIKNVSFKKTSLKKLPFKDNQFKVIVCLSVLEHVSPNELPIVIDHFHRILKPGGFLIAGYPNEGSHLFKLIQTIEPLLIRPRVIMILKNKRKLFDVLGHVSNSKQIDRAIKNRFEAVSNKSLSFLQLKLYSLGKFRKINRN